MRKRFLTPARMKWFALWMSAIFLRIPILCIFVLFIFLGEIAEKAFEWISERIPGPERGS